MNRRYSAEPPTGYLFDDAELRSIVCRLCGFMIDPGPNQKMLMSTHGQRHVAAGEATYAPNVTTSTRSEFLIVSK